MGRFFLGVLRAGFLPPSLRVPYALAVKRLWLRFSSNSCVVRIANVGLISLSPWEFIDSRLFFFGIWEPSVTSFIAGAIRPASTVLDIGAHIGYYSLLMSRLVGSSGHVYSFEPTPQTREKLNKNLQLNCIENTVVCPFGVSDRTEFREFEVDRGGNAGTNRFGALSGTGLELRRISEVVREEHLRQTSLIKIDVEGMELIVLRDILAILPMLRADVTICAELRSSPDLRALLERYKEAGFELYALENVYRMRRYASSKRCDPTQIEVLPDGQHDVALIRRPGRGATTLSPP